MASMIINSTAADDIFAGPSILVEDLKQNLSQSWTGIGVIIVFLTLLTTSIYTKVKAGRPYPNIPVVSLKEEEGLGPKESWLYRGRALLDKGTRLYPGGYQTMSGCGPRIVLPNSFAEEIKKFPDWDFFEWLHEDFFGDYPGLEPQGKRDAPLLIETIRVKVTQALGLITDDLSDEATIAIENQFGDSTEWQTSAIRADVYDVVSQLSSRVFLGKRLARNKAWTDVTKRYAMATHKAVEEMRRWSSFSRPIVHWFLPQCRLVRNLYAEARGIIDGEVKMRSETYRAAIEAGEKPAKLFDAVSWAHDMARGAELDHTKFQIRLALVSIPTTGETLSQAMNYLCENPSLFEPLRTEIIRVIGDGGWQKTTLYKLRLMDSFLKECQRLRPLSTQLVRRLSGKTAVTLSSGLVVPPRAQISLHLDRHMDPAIYPDPEKFDAYRFLRLREQPGGENQHQFVTLNANHLGWGYGVHACPGRFFASNEVKIALCHLLLKYDWRFADGKTQREPDICFETRWSVNPNQRIEFRRRQEEILL